MDLLLEWSTKLWNNAFGYTIQSILSVGTTLFAVHHTNKVTERRESERARADEKRRYDRLTRERSEWAERIRTTDEKGLIEEIWRLYRDWLKQEQLEKHNVGALPQLRDLDQQLNRYMLDANLEARKTSAIEVIDRTVIPPIA